MSPRLFYRTLSIAEAVTWTMLLTGMFLKYVVDVTDVGVTIGGAAHGFVFLAYCMTVVVVGLNQRWSVGLMIGGFASAVVPYATIPFDRWLERRDRLTGGWRRTAVEGDPRDSRPLDRLVRWLIRHPVLFGALFVVALVAVYATLLVVGPPGGD
ncbi:DUF3817 domain-containing protein [Marisediminicola sp. LYQ134]|uniref:DUF3817 domain-containing protein n=1 Tax=unclassified Marisediminicola TaxID=2618316 RepID=UPI0039834C78